MQRAYDLIKGGKRPKLSHPALTSLNAFTVCINDFKSIFLNE